MKHFQNNKGLTLIEIIISVAILGIIVISFITMFSQGMDSIFTVGNKTVATRIAQEHIDEYFTNPGLEPISNKSVEQFIVNSTINTSGPHNTNIVTVTVSYRGGSRTTSITAAVPREGE